MKDAAPQANEIAGPPKQRRWGRWAAFFVALFIGSGAGWWFWPRGDARFVGQWAMWNDKKAEPEGELALWRHGVGSYRAPGNQFVVSFRWHVEGGGKFVIGSKSKDGLMSQHLEALSEVLLEWTGRTFLTDQVIYEVSSLSENEIKLHEKGSVSLILKRVDAK